LAAQFRFTATNEKAAVTAALVLWREARTLLERERSKQPPEKFPRTANPNIPFDEALRRLMPKVDKYVEREKRFRDYLASPQGGGNLTAKESGLIVAGEEIARLKEEGFNQLLFGAHFQNFASWWKEELSRRRSQSGAAGATEKKRLAAEK